MSTEHYQVENSRRRPRPLLSLLIVALITFIAGIAAAAWVLTRWSDAAVFLGIRPAPQPAAVQAPPQPHAIPLTALVATPNGQKMVVDPEMSRRMAQMEQRLADIDAEVRSAAGDADRAEGLLVAFAARRALDRGVGLGYLEGLLRQRFGATQPRAVATIITIARDPVTLQELQEGLQNAGPSLTGGGPNQSWWDAFRIQMRELVTIRKGGTPSPMPSERLARAEQRLEAGQVDIALAEVLRMPARDAAAAWIEDARRYVAARRALDTIETAALLERHGELPPNG